MPEEMEFPYGRNEFGRPTWMGIICRDVGKQRKFYEEVLKMTLVGENEQGPCYSLGGVYMLELDHYDDNNPEASVPGVQMGFEHPDLEKLKEYLDAQGVPTSLIRGGSEGRWFKAWDPEGNIIGFSNRMPRKDE